MRLADRAKSWFELAKQVWKEFTTDNGPLVAGAISFFTFLSIFPALLAAIGILGMVLGSPERAERIILSATQEYAVGTQARDLLTQVVRGGNAATGIGLLLLLWSGTKVVAMLEQAMNVAWDVREKRGFVKQRGVALLMFVLAGVLILLSVAATAVVRYIERANLPILSDWGWLASLASYLIPFLVIVALFTLIYRILPYTDVHWRSALIGGLFAAVLWQIALHVFAYYVANFASYNQVYGSLGAVILLLVWINYSAIIVLLGAELASLLQREREQGAPRRRPSQ